jgi:Domain of unknown function (DUF4389)
MSDTTTTPPPPATEGWEPTELTIPYPGRIAHWRPLVHWILVIPHWIVLAVLGFIYNLLVLVSFFTVLFTKQIPKGIFDFRTMVMRYQWRTSSYAMFMREEYPPFDFTMANEADDPTLPGDPARLGVAYPDELNRWLPLIKWLLIIPQTIVLIFLYIGVFFVMIFTFFAVLFTGKYPKGPFGFVLAVARWTLRVQAYAGLMRDEYPPFTVSMDA